MWYVARIDTLCIVKVGLEYDEFLGGRLIIADCEWTCDFRTYKSIADAHHDVRILCLLSYKLSQNLWASSRNLAKYRV